MVSLLLRNLVPVSFCMLFKHYSRWVPNLTHRDGSAFLHQWEKVFQMDTLWTPNAPKTKKRDYTKRVTP